MKIGFSDMIGICFVHTKHHNYIMLTCEQNRHIMLCDGVFS